MTCVGGEKTWPSWKWKCHTWNYSSFLRAFSTSLAHQRRLSIANWRHLSELLLHEKSENYRISHLSLFDKETIVYKNRVFVFHLFLTFRFFVILIGWMIDFSLFQNAETTIFQTGKWVENETFFEEEQNVKNPVLQLLVRLRQQSSKLENSFYKMANSKSFLKEFFFILGTLLYFTENTDNFEA